MENDENDAVHAACGGWKTIMSPGRVQIREDEENEK